MCILEFGRSCRCKVALCVRLGVCVQGAASGCAAGCRCCVHLGTWCWCRYRVRLGALHLGVWALVPLLCALGSLGAGAVPLLCALGSLGAGAAAGSRNLPAAVCLCVLLVRPQKSCCYLGSLLAKFTFSNRVPVKDLLSSS